MPETADVRVSVVGSVNVDVLYRVDQHPERGATVLAEPCPPPVLGGKGANVAVTAAALGATTRLVAALGDDPHAMWVRDRLTAHGVDTRDCHDLPGQRTGVAMVFLGPDGENSIAVDSGANAAFDASLLEGVDLVAGEVVVAQLEIPAATVAAAFRRAHARGATTVLNVSPAPRHGDAAVHEAISASDVVVVNAGEARALGAVLGTGAGLGAALGDGRWAAVADRWREVDATLGTGGPRTLVVTRGADGILAVPAEGVPVLVPAVPVDVVDTTGAGDAALAAVAVGLARGWDIGRTLRLARDVGALVCRREGAQGALDLVRGGGWAGAR